MWEKEKQWVSVEVKTNERYERGLIVGVNTINRSKTECEVRRSAQLEFMKSQIVPGS